MSKKYLSIKSLNIEEITIECEDNDTIQDVKKKIKDKTGFEEDTQTLVFGN